MSAASEKLATPFASLLVAAWLFALPACLSAMPSPSRVGEWKMRALDQQDFKYEVFTPAADAAGRSESGRAAVIYLENLPSPRIGQESDESIVAGLLADGYVVLVLDLARHPRAVAPHIDGDLFLIRKFLGNLFREEEVDEDWVYILPEGYRLARNVPYYESGEEKFHLDLCYPSQPQRPVPVVMKVSIDHEKRMSNRLAHWLYRDQMSDSVATRGYAVAQVDNPAKWFAGYEAMPQTARRLHAAVRTIRSQAKQHGYDGSRLGVMGFSRSSGAAGLLAMTGGLDEFAGHGPHRQFSSRVQCAVLHAGRMDHAALAEQGHPLAENYSKLWGPVETNRTAWAAHSPIHYVTCDDPPTLLSVGDRDDFRPDQMSRMAAALRQAGVRHKLVISTNTGHWVTIDKQVLGQIYDFIDKHLKADDPALESPSEAAPQSNRRDRFRRRRLPKP